MNPKFMERLETCVSAERILKEEPMSRHTTFRVGGPAELFIKPSLEEAAPVIALCRQFKIPVTVIGNGSNLLVKDSGIRGVVIELGQNAQEITIERDAESKEAQMILGAGTLLSKAAQAAAKEGLCGLEFAAGIPGTAGGALVMNAGAYGGEMKDIVTGAVVLTPEGEKKKLSLEELDLSYRHSAILGSQYLVLWVCLKLQAGEVSEIYEKMKDLSSKRQAKQPLEFPSAGSTFKRPQGNYAGKLIMDAGLAGYQVGDAQVSEKHCGFLINRGNAAAADILQLIQEVQDIVYEKFQVKLEPEIKIIGD